MGVRSGIRRLLKRLSSEEQVTHQQPTARNRPKRSAHRVSAPRRAHIARAQSSVDRTPSFTYGKPDTLSLHPDHASHNKPQPPIPSQALSITVTRSSTQSSIHRASSQHTRNLHKPLPPSPSPMAPEELTSVLDAFDAVASQIAYAACGHTAMAVWGRADVPLPSEATVMCPAHALGPLRSWAAAKGMHVYTRDPRLIGVPRPDGAVRGVRLVLAPQHVEFFERLACVRPKKMGRHYAGAYGQTLQTVACVLALSTLLDLEAERLAGRVEDGVSDGFLWLLQRTVDGGFVEEGGVLEPQCVPHVVDPEFRQILVEGPQHEAETLRLLDQAGLPSYLAYNERQNGARQVSEYAEEDTDVDTDSVYSVNDTRRFSTMAVVNGGDDDECDRDNSIRRMSRMAVVNGGDDDDGSPVIRSSVPAALLAGPDYSGSGYGVGWNVVE